MSFQGIIYGRTCYLVFKGKVLTAELKYLGFSTESNPSHGTMVHFVYYNSFNVDMSEIWSDCLLSYLCVITKKILAGLCIVLAYFLPFA